MGKTGVDSWQPSAIQLERESWRRRQTVRSAAIAAASTLLVLGVVGGLIVSSPGWERVHETYFDWDKAVDSFPAVLAGLWMNVKIMVISAIALVILSLTIAVMFIVITIPLARFTDWLGRRMMRRERAGAR
jgi:polar amino acid transport system permease protein